MDLEEIETTLESALALMPPTWGPEARPVDKVAAMEDYMVRSLAQNAELVRAYHWLREVVVRMRKEWDELQGYEVAMTKPRAKWTKTDVQQAKIQVAPTMYEMGKRAALLQESVKDQIERLDREERVLSRLYTMISA